MAERWRFYWTRSCSVGHHTLFVCFACILSDFNPPWRESSSLQEQRFEQRHIVWQYNRKTKQLLEGGEEREKSLWRRKRRGILVSWQWKLEVSQRTEDLFVQLRSSERWKWDLVLFMMCILFHSEFDFFCLSFEMNPSPWLDGRSL